VLSIKKLYCLAVLNKLPTLCHCEPLPILSVNGKNLKSVPVPINVTIAYLGADS
jgi:hypothetical protein